MTIAVSTILSAFNSLTLSPALAALLLRPRSAKRDLATRLTDFTLGWFFRGFDRAFRASTTFYTHAIGPMLQDLVTGTDLPEAPPPGEPNALAEILGLLGRHSAVDFRPYKPTTILRRISRRMAVTHTRTLSEYHDFLQSHPQEVAELVMALLIKVTEFFRDPEAFTYLKREVLPELFARGREQGRVLRIWSAGCATGEEAYSLALLIADQLAGELNEWSVKVFATDRFGHNILGKPFLDSLKAWEIEDDTLTLVK